MIEVKINNKDCYILSPDEIIQQGDFVTVFGHIKKGFVLVPNCSIVGTKVKQNSGFTFARTKSIQIRLL